VKYILSFPTFHISFAIFIYLSIYLDFWFNLPQILIWELGKTTGLFLAWFKNAKLIALNTMKILISIFISSNNMDTHKQKNKEKLSFISFYLFTCKLVN